MSTIESATVQTRSASGSKRIGAAVKKSKVPSQNGLVESRTRALGADFVAAMRRRAALAPKPLVIGDVVDVFSDRGTFLHRGVVESRDESCAQIRVDQPANGSGGGTSSYHVAIKNCRLADALHPPASLREWEAARGVDTSRPPL